MNYTKRHIIFFLLTLSLGISFYLDFFVPKDISVSFAPINPKKSTTVFAGYSSTGNIPEYVINYLQKLKQITPNIVYVTDNPISKKEILKLKPYVNHIIATRHNEYDWGSYKRGYNFITNKNFPAPNTSPLLILANDSALPVAPSFKPILKDMQEKQTDFYGITANQDGIYHIQSHFLILTSKLYTSTEFKNYLNNVKPQTDGLMVASLYEVPFTKYFEDKGYTHGTFIPYENLSYLKLNDKNCYPLTLLTKHKLPLLKMRTFTSRLHVQESRRMLFKWLKQNSHKSYKQLIRHLKQINSPYLKDNRED
ncbi:MAG: hypothetical protein IKW39_03920 [Alphaproteobacteria bacterium]|nr:hypothetical protein [Alphaproteobacteria bacterium]